MKITTTKQAARVLASFLISDRGYHGPDIRSLSESFPIQSLITDYNLVCLTERTVDPAFAGRELITRINGHLSMHVIELVPDFSEKIQEFFEHHLGKIEWIEYLEKHCGWNLNRMIELPGITWR